MIPMEIGMTIDKALKEIQSKEAYQEDTLVSH